MAKAKNGKQAEFYVRFADAYIANGENQTRAYLAVKPNVTLNTAAVEGHKLLRIPKVRELIDQRRASLRAKYSLTTERVVQEQARIIYFSPKKLLDENGRTIPLHQLDDDTAAGLANIEITETEIKGKGKDQVITTRKVKGRPFNKVSALNMANKILRVYDKPPPPPPDASGEQRLADPRETARRMAFLLRQGATTPKKKLPA